MINQFLFIFAALLVAAPAAAQDGPWSYNDLTGSWNVMVELDTDHDGNLDGVVDERLESRIQGGTPNIYTNTFLCDNFPDDYCVDDGPNQDQRGLIAGVGLYSSRLFIDSSCDSQIGPAPTPTSAFRVDLTDCQINYWVYAGNVAFLVNYWSLQGRVGEIDGRFLFDCSAAGGVCNTDQPVGTWGPHSYTIDEDLLFGTGHNSGGYYVAAESP